MMVPTPCTLTGLNAYARARGLSVRLSIEPAGTVAHDCVRLSRLSIYDGPGKDAGELDGVDFPVKRATTIDEAAALLYEYVQRTITTED